MPLYDYRCPTCKFTQEVYQSMSEPHELRSCSCGGVAQRVWTPVAAHPNTQEASWNPAFGKVTRTKGDVKDEVSRVEDETGQKLIELGTESVNVKPKVEHYPTAAEMGIV